MMDKIGLMEYEIKEKIDWRGAQSMEGAITKALLGRGQVQIQLSAQAVPQAPWQKWYKQDVLKGIR